MRRPANPGDYRQHPKPRPERVYYVQVGDGVKIGTTIDMKKRMVAIRNASPSAKLLATEPGGRSLEHLRHAEFTASRIGNSEVFRPTPQLMAHIDRIALGGNESQKATMCGRRSTTPRTFLACPRVPPTDGPRWRAGVWEVTGVCTSHGTTCAI